jgi:hypothetical protein
MQARNTFTMSLFMISSMISLEGRIAYCLHMAEVVQEKNLFITSKDPGIIPRVVNVLTPLVYS